jgi:hypothetical protein
MLLINRADNYSQFTDEEYENVTQDEGFDLEMANSQNEKEFEFSINTAATQRQGSDETPFASTVSNPIAKTGISISAQRKNPRERISAGVSNSNQNAVSESFIILPPKKSEPQEPSPASLFPWLEPTRATPPQIVIKPEEQAPSQLTDLQLPDFPDAQQLPNSYPTTEQESTANPVHNNSQVDQSSEASNESSQVQRENGAQEPDNTEHRRYKNIRINIYYFYRRGRGIPE